MIIKVAVIEDDDIIRKSIITFLRSKKEIECVASYGDAESAIAELTSITPPDVILMDINLPNMSGIDCVQQIKKLIPNSLIIMLTVYNDSNKIFKSLQAGAVGYLLKSDSPDDIFNAIKNVYAGGSPMSALIARKVVQSFHNQQNFVNNNVQLTTREKEILDLLSKGYLYKEIAHELNISVNTVHNHLRHIYEKLQVHNRTEAVLKHLQL